MATDIHLRNRFIRTKKILQDQNLNLPQMLWKMLPCKALQNIAFKFDKLHCTERLYSLKQKDITLSEVEKLIIWDEKLFYTYE